jgi:hypothetical protein
VNGYVILTTLLPDSFNGKAHLLQTANYAA